MSKVIPSLMAVLIGFSAAAAFASGGGGYGGGSYSSPRKVDKTYEYGKAIYTGRIASVGKVNFCVVKGEEKVKVKRSSIKPYAGKPTNDLAQNLYDCDMPEDKIITKLGKENTQYVLYYLNKRYKLKLI